jgi:serine protease Do
MTSMFRGLVVAALLSLFPRVDAGQALSVLHITVVLEDGEGKVTPVPRHLLLISDNPSTAPPRRIFTSPDGSVDVPLRPGNYTIESDRPIAFEGKAYQWTQMLDIVAGRDAVLELTAKNAEVETTTSATTPASHVEDDPASLLTRWQGSVVAIWTPTAHASGFVIDANGLIATNQRAIGAATTIEVQLTQDLKVAASVVVADAVRDVAVLRIDPAIVASVRPVPLECAPAAQSAVVDGQEIVAIEVPLRQEKGATSGTVSRVATSVIDSDLTLAVGGAGGPVFTAGGSVVGIASVVDESGGQRRERARVVRIGEVCDVVARAQKRMKDTAAPNGTHLPVEPVRPFPIDAAQRSAGALTPYKLSSSDFDIAFLTPLQVHATQEDFGNWSEYVADAPPVLLVRVTPKQAEGFWTKVARGAAYTQGVSLPPIKRFKPGFSRMRVFCGDTELTPIHPFKLERRVSESDAIYEGLYVFDPGALGPTCGGVKLLLYSEKEPEKGDTQVVDAKVLEQIWQDFAPYRALK